MTENYNSAAEKVRAHAEGAGIPSNVAAQVTAQRSANSNVIRENGGKIDQNETPVQASSDILRNEHQGAVKGQQIGRTEEDLKQTLPVWDSSEKRDNFKDKLERLREEQRKAS
jgi:conjugal transfer mating pair stabilization protein TraG